MNHGRIAFDSIRAGRTHAGNLGVIEREKERETMALSLGR